MTAQVKRESSRVFMGVQGGIFEGRIPHGYPDTSRRFLEGFRAKIRGDLKVFEKK